MSESVKLENLLGMLTIKLNDDNFIKWNFQFCSVLRGYDLFDHFTGEFVCPPKYVLNFEMEVTKEISTTYKTLWARLFDRIRWDWTGLDYSPVFGGYRD
ncbi:hypothetical protein PS1_024310 [Malus domestica]